MKEQPMKEVMDETMKAIGRKPNGYDPRIGMGNYWEIENGNECYCMVGSIKDRLSSFHWKNLSPRQWLGSTRTKEQMQWVRLALFINGERKLRLYVEFVYIDIDREDFFEALKELGI